MCWNSISFYVKWRWDVKNSWSCVQLLKITSVKYFQEGVSTPSTWATSRACSGGPWPPTPPTGGRGCTRSAPPRRQLPRPRMRRPRRGRGWSTLPRRGPARWTAPSCCAATCATPPSPTPSWSKPPEAATRGWRPRASWPGPGLLIAGRAPGFRARK